MQIDHFDVQSPALIGGESSEAEILGAAVWLWMHSPLHRDAPLQALSTLLLPIIKHQQYVVVSQQQQPIFFMSWAWLDAEAERRYLTQPSILMPQDDWACGDRMWIIDWIAPFGHSRAMRHLVGHTLLPDYCFRSLDHQGARRGKRVFVHHGDQVSRQSRDHWLQQHPLAEPLPEICIR
ncbi:MULTISPECIES: toxin-activating lysine-acyltransferase [Dickeya]|jgi:cytolysin-activating lysine-acyltransferase|uniref:toxin-activating lysine-acyltransferase n=1 Tax=Dickeya TaxID=204037 RepID=UPI00039DFBEC|nr:MULTISPECIES: toxin-activating lysine-acyltransferase [Dickeya]PXW43873.1 cytolysin-activating lysine-acyltransferase [Erwinia sp. AG740]AUQ27211.1 toxin-activating lysine-acyltransferase [Dickeya zeae]MCO7254747.1 toxin-activating lysine-acyltransferase [Dickeya oryzae]UJR60266.1 toxin-activating lysine-acyltransferase [Dickeya zeae]UJR63905.1 toxin-activating lysine-acyltransferase [Dickeya zeae]